MGFPHSFAVLDWASQCSARGGQNTEVRTFTSRLHQPKGLPATLAFHHRPAWAAPLDQLLRLSTHPPIHHGATCRRSGLATANASRPRREKNNSSETHPFLSADFAGSFEARPVVETLGLGRFPSPFFRPLASPPGDDGTTGNPRPVTSVIAVNLSQRTPKARCQTSREGVHTGKWHRRQNLGKDRAQRPLLVCSYLFVVVVGRRKHSRQLTMAWQQQHHRFHLPHQQRCPPHPQTPWQHRQQRRPRRPPPHHPRYLRDQQP